MNARRAAIVLAAALACVPAAEAQSRVTLSGLVDAYAGSIRMAGDGGGTRVVGSGGLTTSWFGVSGSEDLGGGLSATFKVTSFLRADTGSVGRFTGDPFFSRDANVGLAGGFGTVTLGRGLAPNFLPTILANPFGDSFTFSPLVLHANVSTAGWAPVTTPADTGWSNEVIYGTPTWGGFSANLHYQFGEQASSSGLDGRRNVGINALFMGGPLTLVGFYERAQVSNPVVPSPFTVGGLPQSKKDWMLGGAYDFRLAKAYATYGEARHEVTDFKARTASLGLDVPLAGGTVKAGMARTEVEGAFHGSRNTGTVGYDYFLSKRTDLYAMLMRDSASNLSRGTSLGLGMRHRF